LTDFVGAIVELYTFDAYGNAIGFDPSVALTEFLYSGEQFDSKIGQQYLRARYYNPTTGRFNRLDPFFGNLNDPQSLHKYLYVHGNPINGIDPSGMMSVGSIGVSMAIGAQIGATVGVTADAIYGAYTGYNRTGSLFTFDIIKYGLIGAVGGAAAGAFIGATVHLSPYIFNSLRTIMSSGWRSFVTKCSNPQGHTTTENAYKMGLVVGVGLGLYDPDFMTELKALGGTTATITSDIFIRGLIARRLFWATTGASRTFVLFLSKYAQAGTYVTSSFLVGFTLGYPLGSGLRMCGDALYNTFNEIISEESVTE
jgi:RHS repeat-associated protein